MILDKLNNKGEEAGQHVEADKKKDDPEFEQEQEQADQYHKPSQPEPMQVLENKRLRLGVAHSRDHQKSYEGKHRSKKRLGYVDVRQADGCQSY